MSFHSRVAPDCVGFFSLEPATYFLLGLDAKGCWVIRESNGCRAGLFRTREAALKFAREGTPSGNFTIMFCPEGLEFEPGLMTRAA